VQAKDAINREAMHSRQSMRAFMSALREAGELVSISQPVRLEYEVAGCLAELDSGPALHFTEVAGTSDRGRDADRGQSAQFAATVCPGTEQHDRADAGVSACGDRQAVAASRGFLGTLVDQLPIPRFFEREGGPYITAGAIVARDKLTGNTNLSIARLMPLDGNSAFVGIAPNHHLTVLARAAHARGEKLDIAVCVGNHPAVLMAACLYLGLGEDELPIAGALLGEPLEVVRCEESGLLVPAHCESVLEGTLDAGEPFMEGPVSEFHGMYENHGAGIVATFSRLTPRLDAIFQVFLPGYHPEHCLLGGVAVAAGLLRGIRPAVPSVCNAAVGVGGAARLHAVVALRAPRPSEARKAIFAVWAAVNLIKQVTVVDDDIDPWDALQVEWAHATCSKQERDFVIVPGLRADRSEPLERDGTIGKLGIDATRKQGDRPDWELARPPQPALARAREILRENQLA
jgi:2,5-furandicarboxylate decarboxylase 1